MIKSSLYIYIYRSTVRGSHTLHYRTSQTNSTLDTYVYVLNFKLTLSYCNWTAKRFHYFWSGSMHEILSEIIFKKKKLNYKHTFTIQVMTTNGQSFKIGKPWFLERTMKWIMITFVIKFFVVVMVLWRTTF